MNENKKIELKIALASALEIACEGMDLKEMDWTSYNPDFHAKEQERLAA